jgi:hypothetical protein
MVQNGAFRGCRIYIVVSIARVPSVCKLPRMKIRITLKNSTTVTHMLVILLIQSRLVALYSAPSNEVRVSGISTGYQMKLHYGGMFLRYHSETLCFMNV